MPIVVGVTTLAHLPYFLIGVNDSFIGDNLTERLIQCLAMQKPLATPSQPEPENKCLGCFFMKLEGIPVQPQKQDILNLKPKFAATEQVNLHLTIQFNEQRELLLGGHLKFGLKGGKLRIQLENSEIPLESRQLIGSFELSIQTERPQQEDSQNQSTVRDSVAKDQSKVKANLNKNQPVAATDKFQVTVCQVTTTGSQENPAWIFEVERGEPVLKGFLKNATLATMNVMAKPCSVQATFEVLPQDVYMTEAKGLWSQNISKKRRAVIERAIIRRFLERKLMPYLSRQELRFDILTSLKAW